MTKKSHQKIFDITMENFSYKKIIRKFGPRIFSRPPQTRRQVSTHAYCIGFPFRSASVRE